MAKCQADPSTGGDDHNHDRRDDRDQPRVGGSADGVLGRLWRQVTSLRLGRLIGLCAQQVVEVVAHEKASLGGLGLLHRLFGPSLQVA